MNKNEILNELIKAGILSESDAQIVYYNIHQLDKLAKADTPEHKKTLKMNKYTFIKIRKIVVSILMWILLLSLSANIFYKYVCGVKTSPPPNTTTPHHKPVTE